MKTTVRVIRREANGTNLDDRTMDFEGPHGNIAHWFEELRTGQVIEIQTDIVGETYEPMQLDLGTLIARLEQIKEELDARDKEYREGHWLWDRVITCDLPRLQKYLTVAMRQDRDAVQRLRKAMSNADSNGIGVQVLQQEIYMADRDRLYWTQLATYHATMLVYEALPVDPR